MVSSKILETITKLLAHEESARSIGNIEEAAAFASRIQSLLSKYKLEMSEVELFQREKEDISDTLVYPGDIGVEAEDHPVMWQFYLALGIAEANNCRLLNTLNSNHHFFVGRRSDREISIRLFSYFVKMAMDCARKEFDSQVKPEPLIAIPDMMFIGHPEYELSIARLAKQSRRIQWPEFMKSFCLGFTKAIAERMVAEKERAEQQAAQARAKSKAMVMIKRDEVKIDRHMDKEFPNARRNADEAGAQPTEDEVDWDAFVKGLGTGRLAALTDKTLK